MIRWICVCLLLSAGAVATVWAIAPKTIGNEEKTVPEDAPAIKKVDAADPVEPPPAKPAVAHSTPSAPSQRVLPQLIEYAPRKDAQFTDPIYIPGGILVIYQIQETSAEKDGKILFIGTDVQPGEVVPQDKQLPDAELGFLAVPVAKDETPKEGEKFFPLYRNSDQLFRRLREGDPLEPNKIHLAKEFRPVRKLQVGDPIKRGQLLALVNPKKAFDDVSIKVAKLGAADADRLASQKQKLEYKRRHDSAVRANSLQPGTVSKDDVEAAKLQSEKFAMEEKVKEAEITKSQRELNAALTDLKMHEIRAAIDGVVKVIYKNHEGEAIKPNEAVLQIQNPSRLRVEGLLEVQEARKLRPGMEVVVEATRPESPRLVIGGHLNTVNCVAISKGERPVIVSGSDDETLRGWDGITGEKLWALVGLKSAVRAAACTPAAAKRNLVLFGTADGSVRLLDLDKVKEEAHDLAERHRGPVTCVAFSPDGETCATCGEDQSICLWKTETGELLHRLTQAHRGPVTSVQFASAKVLVSAGRDNRLAVWDVEGGRPPRRLYADFEGRGGEVAQVGVSPDGKTVLFDQGKELRLLSLTDNRQIEGTVQNPSEAMNFSTMALFSPDGKAILTNGSAPGKLQLWRTPEARGRASELRQFIWTRGTATCGAFAPDGSFAATGTQDHMVLVWAMPGKDEVESRLTGHLTLVERQLDTQSRQVRVWAEVQKPDWLVPGSRATMVVRPQQK